MIRCSDDACNQHAARTGRAASVPLRHAQTIPALIVDAGNQAIRSYVGCFATDIGNPNTRRAYDRACRTFFAWCKERGLALPGIRPVDVAAYISVRQHTRSATDVRQQLAALRVLFRCLIAARIVRTNPAARVRGPRYAARAVRSPALDGTDWRRLIDSIPRATVRDLRDRALMATLTYAFARVTAALRMKVEDLHQQDAGWVLRLPGKDGTPHVVPCHHALLEALAAYIDAAGIADDPAGWLFRTSRGHVPTALSAQPMRQSDAWRMIRRRAEAAGIAARIGNHSLRATGIAAYLRSGGMLEHAQSMAEHDSPRSTLLYDRAVDALTWDEVERIRL